jgi:hypothetical protein
MGSVITFSSEVVSEVARQSNVDSMAGFGYRLEKLEISIGGFDEDLGLVFFNTVLLDLFQPFCPGRFSQSEDSRERQISDR